MKKKNPIFHVALIVFDHETILDFRFFSIIHFLDQILLLEYWRVPIEGIHRETTNLHRFCGNEEKDT